MKTHVTINGKEIKLHTAHTQFEYDILSLIAALDGITFEKKEEKKPWSPETLEDGKRYWYINSDGEIDTDRWYSRYDEDIYRRKTKNIYQTREDAQAALDKIMNS